MPSKMSNSKKFVVKRTEQIWLKPNKTLSQFCHLSKNLYNQANYLIKQTLHDQSHWLSYQERAVSGAPRRVRGAERWSKTTHTPFRFESSLILGGRSIPQFGIAYSVL